MNFICAQHNSTCVFLWKERKEIKIKIGVFVMRIEQKDNEKIF